MKRKKIDPENYPDFVSLDSNTNHSQIPTLINNYKERKNKLSNVKGFKREYLGVGHKVKDVKEIIHREVGDAEDNLFFNVIFIRNKDGAAERRKTNFVFFIANYHEYENVNLEPFYGSSDFSLVANNYYDDGQTCCPIP